VVDENPPEAALSIAYRVGHPDRNDVPGVSSIDLKVGIDRPDDASLKSLGKPDEAGIGQGHGHVPVSLH
jgi:hypothetical protein